MTALENTLIAIARDQLAAVRRFYALKTEGKAKRDDYEQFREDHVALTTLLQLGHMANSGMSEEGIKVLQGIEADAAASIPEGRESGGLYATITMHIEGKEPDQFSQAMSNAFDIASFGGAGGNGVTPNGTSYTCTVETNLPKKPLTLNNLLGMLDEHCDPEEREQLRQIYGTDHLNGNKPD